MLNPYSPAKISTCLTGSRVVFLGDSITRQVYFAAAKMLDPAFEKGAAERHSSRSVQAEGVTMDLVWDPFLNTSDAASLLSGNYLDAATGQQVRPSLLVVGTGLWHLRHFEQPQALSAYRGLIDRIYTSAASGTLADEVVLLPVEPTVEDRMSPIQRSTMHNDDIDAMNLYLRAKDEALPLSQPSHPKKVAVPWVFNDLIYGLDEETLDGLHYSDAICQAQANILLNLRCNDGQLKKFPSQSDPGVLDRWLMRLLEQSTRPAVRRIRRRTTFSGCFWRSWRCTRPWGTIYLDKVIRESLMLDRLSPIAQTPRIQHSSTTHQTTTFSP
jgi:hypothetical protein